MRTLVLDAGEIGGGAARMNAGFIGRTLKKSLGWLEAHRGEKHALGIYNELSDAFSRVGTVIEDEGIECHYRTCGRYIAANSARHLQELTASLDELKNKLGLGYQLVVRSNQDNELKAGRYCGGVVIPDLASIHPGLYHDGLLKRAVEAGVMFQSGPRVFRITGDAKKKIVETAAGRVAAREILVATNGYATGAFHWLARGLVPFRGYAVATEILPTELIDAVLTKRRTYLDTKVNIDFIRSAPDSERIIFDGMSGGLSGNARLKAVALRERFVDILPDLRGVKIGRTWTGFCAGTLEFMSHIGYRRGIHFASGYNFAGVPIGTMFGQKIAFRILGAGDGFSFFERTSIPKLPFHCGSGLLAPVAMRYFDLLDSWKTMS